MLIGEHKVLTFTAQGDVWHFAQININIPTNSIIIHGTTNLDDGSLGIIGIDNVQVRLCVIIFAKTA